MSNPDTTIQTPKIRNEAALRKRGETTRGLIAQSHVRSNQNPHPSESEGRGTHKGVRHSARGTWKGAPPALSFKNIYTSDASTFVVNANLHSRMDRSSVCVEGNFENMASNRERYMRTLYHRLKMIRSPALGTALRENFQRCLLRWSYHHSRRLDVPQKIF
jgi:hypothetical protein